ncbi:MAG: hypothetical protein ABI833_20265 [Acidobacteriota bacterium]
MRTASQLADASGIDVFGSREDPKLTTRLLDALGIPAPLEFMAKFTEEYNSVQACAA